MIQNAVYVVPTEKYYVSVNRHDLVTFTLDGTAPNLNSGNYFFIEGGHDYRRCNFKFHPEIMDFSLYEDSSDDEIYDKLLWGSRGTTGKEPLQYVLLKNLNTEHMNAILSTQPHIDQHVRNVIAKALLNRTKEVN